MKDLKILFAYGKPYRKAFVLAVLFVMIETSFELIIPMIMADIIDIGVVNHDVDLILIQGVKMGICALISLVCGLLYARYVGLAANGFGAELRKAEFKKIQEYSFANLDHFDTSSLITRLSSDVSVLQNAISGGLRPMVRGPVMLVLGLGVAFYINAKLALVFLICAPILGLILFAIVKKIAPMYGKLQNALDQVNSTIQENLNAIRVVKAFVRGEYEIEKFERVNQDLKQTAEATFHYAVLNQPAFQLTMYASIVLILWFGGNLIFIGNMKVGELTGFLSYVLQIMNSLMMISNVFLMLTRSLASARRISEIFEEELDLADGDAFASIEHGDIEFRNVSFKYNPKAKQNTLSKINIKIKAGETIGIIGGTGSGKSSLVQLIPRLYDVNEGEVLIDGKNVKEYSLKHLRDAIGMVLQKNVLFSGTIKENLLWGNPQASDEELAWASHVAAVDEFIDNFPQRYETDLGQGGVNVSGGQKQRLCIARALLKHPKVMIFDDSTSAVDTATEARIKEGLASLKAVTKLIIAQRITSIMDADQIIIMEDGRVHAIGKHEDLLANNKIYQEIYYSQQKGGELNG